MSKLGKMAKQFYKHKLHLDENFPVRSLPLSNRRFDLKHIAADLDLAGIADPQVYKYASRDSRLLVTYNIKDFIELAEKSSNTEVIGISHNLSFEQIDKN